MARRVKLSGFRELENALAELPKATGKNVLRRTLKIALSDVEEAAKANAPNFSGTLIQSLTTGTRLTRRQSAMARKAGKSTMEMHMGTADPAGVQVEFGNSHQSPQPFMRPAWDQNKDEVLETVGRELSAQINRSATRLAKKAARAGKK